MDRKISFSHRGSSLTRWGLVLLLLSVVAQGFQSPLTATTHPSRSSSTRTTAFVRTSPQNNRVPQEAARTTTALLMSSYSADGSEYSSKESDYDDDGLPGDDYDFSNQSEQEMAPTVELQPVPMSKNAGNRFVAFVWDQELDTSDRDALELHEDRDALTEDHVMFCRKRNLYNETFNTDSMVDIFWSLQTLSSDLKRAVGHVMFLESQEFKHVNDMLQVEPILHSLTKGAIDNVPLYRWRHIRDFTLRQDDGRFGCPCMLVAMDTDDDMQDSVTLRTELKEKYLEHLIRSERVIAAGPLHLPTELKNDPSSAAVGDLILFNAKNREEAVAFAENLPTAQEGLYKEMRVHFYNNIDVTGKFVSEDPLRDAPGYQMKEALEVWGYPVADEQTPWLNW